MRTLKLAYHKDTAKVGLHLAGMPSGAVIVQIDRDAHEIWAPHERVDFDAVFDDEQLGTPVDLPTDDEEDAVIGEEGGGQSVSYGSLAGRTRGGDEKPDEGWPRRPPAAHSVSIQEAAAHPSFVEPSLGELAQQALHERIVDACAFNKEHAIISHGGERLRMSQDDAWAYLLGLLRGWWMLVLDVPFATAQTSAAVEPASSPAVNDVRDRPPKESSASDEIRPYLDLLIRFAKQRGVIQHATMDSRDQTVTLHLAACSSNPMSYEDVVEFLSDCILDEVHVGG